MQPSPIHESAAHVIAENVISALERERPEVSGFVESERGVVTARLVRDLLFVIPTTSSRLLAGACNRALDDTAGMMGLAGPRVAAVDVGDGSVTMRGV